MAVNLARSCKIWPKFSHVYRCLQSPGRFVFKNNVSIRQLATKARTTKEAGEDVWKVAGKLTLGSGLIVALKLARSPSSIAHCEARNRLSDIQVLQFKESKFDWGKLWRLLKPHSWLLVIAIASAFIVALLNIKIPLALGSIVNVVSQFLSGQKDGRDYFEALKDPGIKLSIMYIAQAFFTFVYIHSLSCVGERMASQLREELFTNIIKQDIEFFDTHRTGELVNRLTADVQEFKSSFKMCISQGLRSVAQTAGCIVSLYVISPWLTGCIGVIVPTVIAVGSAMGKGLRELSKATQAQVARATSVCEEAISNVRTVRAFAMEDQEAHLYASEIQKARMMSEELGMGIALFQAGANLFLNGMVLATIGLGGSLLSQGQLTPGDLIAFLVATQTIQRSLGQLSLITGHAVRGLSAGARVFEYCDLRANIPLRGGKTIPFHSLFGELEFRNVSFAYPARPDQTVLRNFSLKIPAGKVVALVGTSGGGKSTIAALLERFYDVQEGRVLLDNQDIRQLDPSWLRGSAIGFINQEPILFATSIKENIRYGKPGATDQEVIEAARLANADEFIRQFPQGYETVVGERGATVSGGQKQRIAIARALLKNPSILILDEATSALDAESERVVQEALDRVAAGRTVLVVAHRLSTVRNADLIAVVANGKIVEIGTHESLRKLRGYYWELVRQQEKKDAS